jgi:hypothetical protein
MARSVMTHVYNQASSGVGGGGERYRRFPLRPRVVIQTFQAMISMPAKKSRPPSSRTA